MTYRDTRPRGPRCHRRWRFGAAAWGFDRGSISEDGSEATAVFSCAAPSGSGKDELRVSAKKTVAGEWEVTHEIQRGKPR